MASAIRLPDSLAPPEAGSQAPEAVSVFLCSRSRCEFPRQIFPACGELPRPVRRGLGRRGRRQAARCCCALFGCGATAAPGTTLNFTARPRTPLADAMARRFASALNDMSTTVCDSAILMTSSLPCTLHSPAESIETRMRWLPSVSACRTAVCRRSRSGPAAGDCATGIGWPSGAEARSSALLTARVELVPFPGASIAGGIVAPEEARLASFLCPEPFSELSSELCSEFQPVFRSASLSITGCGARSRIGAGAAEPMITGSDWLAAATMRGPLAGAGADEAS